jgi:hypothetical protein
MFKNIKCLIRFIKKFIYSFEAEPITKFKKSNIKFINLLVNSSNRKRKLVYYIIKRTPGAGLFSNFIYVLNHLKIAYSCGYEPAIDMENFKTIYNEKNKINNTKNSWNYFFDNKKKINLKKIYKENNFIISTNKFVETFTHRINNDEFRYLFNKYFKIKNIFIKYADDFYKKKFKKKMLAIHLRGTSYKTSANHPFPITIEQTINLIDEIIKKYNYNKIFLCTEDLGYFDAIIKIFKEKVIFLPGTYKSYKDDAFNIYPRSFHRYKLGRDILMEALLISKCDGFIYTTTNVSEFVRFLDKKNKINYFSIQNNFNSQNAYIAKWLWYYKKKFPPSMGGFKKKTYVKKS